MKHKKGPWSCIYILLFFVSFVPGNGFAQFEHKLFTSNDLVEVKFHYGFIYAHHLELEIFNSHFPSFEISIQKATYGKARWERNFAYPYIGIDFFYSSLGFNEVLGQAYALMPFINFPLYKHKKFIFGFRFALGVGYLTKHFDRINNYKDLAIGSHFNAAVNLMLEARYKLTNRLELSGGFCLQHFSNGSLKLPNYGVNALMANIGVAYRLAKPNVNLVDHHYPPIEPFEAILRHYIEFNIGGLVGWKDMDAVLGEKYMVYHFFENTFVQVSRKSKFGVGLDLSYDASDIGILEHNGTTVDNKLEILKPGISAAYMLLLSKLGFVINFGAYLGGKDQSDGIFYEKLGFQYNITKNLFANVTLKVHWGRADYIGWGFGYRFLMWYGRKTLK